MPFAIVQQKTFEEKRRTCAQAAQTGGLSSLQATLQKLQGDQSRHEQLVNDLAKRMAMRRGLVKSHTQEHKAMSFHQSGYVFMKTIGSGRHGMIKLAKRKSSEHVKHTKIGKTAGEDDAISQYVAVRVIQRCAVRRGRLQESELMSTKESHATLLRHIQALKMLDHPNISREIETFEDQQQIYIVMELYTGGDLLEKENDPLEEDRVAWIVSQICSGLVHAHSQGIVHQDIRPDNVHYASSDEEARVVLTDWCCTEQVSTPPAESRKHLIISEYSAPELCPEHRTDRADMWSLGVPAYVLLAFATPFGEHGPRESAADFKWHESDPSVSPECKDFIQKVLKLNPASRLSAKDAMSHPWLAKARQAKRGGGKGKRKSLSTTVASSLLRFKDSSVLHRTAAALAADHLSGEQLAELTRQFEAIDKDGDGQVLKQDMIDALASTLQDLSTGDLDAEDEGLAGDIQELLDSQSKVTALVNLMDTDGDGKISYSDFLAAAAEASMSSCTALYWEAFKAFDKDGNGTISQSELQDLLDTPIMDEAFEKSRQNGMHMEAKTKPEFAKALAELGGNAHSADEIFAALDDDGDRKISFEEFMGIIMGTKGN